MRWGIGSNKSGLAGKKSMGSLGFGLGGERNSGPEAPFKGVWGWNANLTTLPQLEWNPNFGPDLYPVRGCTEAQGREALWVQDGMLHYDFSRAVVAGASADCMFCFDLVIPPMELPVAIEHRTYRGVRNGGFMGLQPVGQLKDLNGNILTNAEIPGSTGAAGNLFGMYLTASDYRDVRTFGNVASNSTTSRRYHWYRYTVTEAGIRNPGINTASAFDTAYSSPDFETGPSNINGVDNRNNTQFLSQPVRLVYSLVFYRQANETSNQAGYIKEFTLTAT